MLDKVIAAYGIQKILKHPEKIESLMEGVITAPIAVRVKPTNLCDHSCHFCSYATGHGDNMEPNLLAELVEKRDIIPESKMMEILSDFKEMGVKGITYSGGGEPLIYPFIIDSLKRTLDYGIDLSIITNGQNLVDEKFEYLTQAKWVRISLDGCTPETVKKSRLVSEQRFRKLEDNMKRFGKEKKSDCEFGVNFVIHHINSHEIYESVGFFQDLGLDHVKFTPKWIDHDKVDQSTGLGWIEYHDQFKESVLDQIARARNDFDINIYDTYENDFNLTGKDFRPYNRCPTMQITPVIGADQFVYTCHDKAYTQDGKIGSLENQSFQELWSSPEVMQFMKNFDPQLMCKHHCTYDSRNILVNDLLDKKGIVSEEMLQRIPKGSINFP